MRPVDGEELDAPVFCVADLAVGDRHVLEVGHGFGAELDRALIALEPAAGGYDVAAWLGAGCLEADGIVAALDVAVLDADVLARVDVEAVVVRHAVAFDFHAGDADIAALEKIRRPRA